MAALPDSNRVAAALRRLADRRRPAAGTNASVDRHRRSAGPRPGRCLPRLWLFTDRERLPQPIPVAARLPRGSAVVARWLASDILHGLARLARRRGLMLLVAGDGRTALRYGVGLHMPDRPGGTRHLLPFLMARRPSGVLTVAAHGRAGIARGRRLHADAVILSPVFPTASHPGLSALGPLRWSALARRAGRPTIALGGIDPGNARRLPPSAVGIAGIGALAGLAAEREAAPHPVAASQQCLR